MSIKIHFFTLNTPTKFEWFLFFICAFLKDGFHASSPRYSMKFVHKTMLYHLPTITWRGIWIISMKQS